MKYKSKGDVEWYFPNCKRPFAYSTVATSDLLVVLSEQCLKTIDVYNAINYDPEGKEIMKKFIDKGFGNFVFRDFVHSNPERVFRKIENGEILHIQAKDLNKYLDKNIAKNNIDYDYEY